MRSKFGHIALFISISVILSSCRSNADELENRFHKYAPDKNVVAVLDDSVFYFSDHTLDLREVVNGEELNNGYMFADNKLYFSVSKQNGISDYSFLIYECDMEGNNKSIIFEKHGYKTSTWATENNGIFYIEHYGVNAFDAESRIIDSYTVSTGTYETVSTGERYSLSDYRRNARNGYSVVESGDSLTIMDPQQKEICIIDHNVLQNSEFGEALMGLDYSFNGLYVVNNRIYLSYRIHTNSPPYPCFICEYTAETGQIVFTSFFLANDMEDICLTYKP